MKNIKLIFTIALAIGLASCSEDFLTVKPTSSKLAGGEATEDVLKENLASSYQCMLFDSYANQNYNSLVVTSEIMGDDAFKGGSSASDQSQLYDIHMFNASGDQNLGGLWNVLYSGIARCSEFQTACDNAVGVDAKVLAAYKAEAKLLRVYYFYYLWRYWGNVPYYEGELSSPFFAPQLTADEIYAKMVASLDEVIAEKNFEMTPKGNNLGRMGRAAAMMLKARIVMYQNDKSKYQEVAQNMGEIIASGEYSLYNDFAGMWLDEGEFCSESIFEVNHIPGAGQSWSNGWYGYGTNMPAFISQPFAVSDLGLNSGWGFCPVREAAWNFFNEAGDTRREGSINDLRAYDHESRFQDVGFYFAKYAARTGYKLDVGDGDLNYANNLRIFRYAETLLNYAELVGVEGATPYNGITAQSCLDAIRKRAFGADNSIPVNLANIKSERRKEFMGEGMRYWDLIRWGDAATALTENETFVQFDKSVFNQKRTWTENKKYLPIPQADIDRTAGTEFEVKQNPY